MSNYVKSTNFAVKDSLATGDPAKKIVGTDIDTEFNNIATAVNSKANAASAALTGTPTAPTAVAGTNTTQVATTAFVTGAITDSASSTEILTNKTLVAPTLGTPASGILTNCTGLPVAGGGTGAATLTANAVLTGNGTGAVGSVAPGTSGNVLTSNGTVWASATPTGGIGAGQTWQDVTASRIAGTTYTNSTGKPIMLNITLSYTYPANVQTAIIYVNAAAAAYWNTHGGYSAAQVGSAIVPNGATYRVDITGAYAHVPYWFELR